MEAKFRTDKLQNGNCDIADNFVSPNTADFKCTREVGGWKNDELKGKNKENKGVLVFGSLSFRVLGLRS